jgi:hypothetical protein
VKRSLTLLAISLLCCSCVAQNSDGWQEFVADDAGFRASLPCKPKREVQEYDYSVGKRFGYTFSCSRNGTSFKIDFGDHNPETGESVQKFLEYSEGDIELAFKTFILAKEDIFIDTLAGRRYVINPDGGKYLITAVTSNKKGILHATVGPVSMPVSPEDEKIFKRIIDSIRFLSK